MKTTRHAEIRAKQRGIPTAIVETILEHGRPVRKPGGAWEYRLTKKHREQLIFALKEEIKRIEKSAGKGILIGGDGAAILTVYHLS